MFPDRYLKHEAEEENIDPVVRRQSTCWRIWAGTLRRGRSASRSQTAVEGLLTALMPYSTAVLFFRASIYFSS